MRTRPGWVETEIYSACGFSSDYYGGGLIMEDRFIRKCDDPASTEGSIPTVVKNVGGVRDGRYSPCCALIFIREEPEWTGKCP